MLTAFRKQEKKKTERKKGQVGFLHKRAGRGWKDTDPLSSAVQVTKEEVVYTVELNVLFY